MEESIRAVFNPEVADHLLAPHVFLLPSTSKSTGKPGVVIRQRPINDVDPSTSKDIVLQRVRQHAAMTGESGKQGQAFLHALGVVRSDLTQHLFKVAHALERAPLPGKRSSSVLLKQIEQILTMPMRTRTPLVAPVGPDTPCVDMALSARSTGWSQRSIQVRPHINPGPQS